MPVLRGTRGPHAAGDVRDRVRQIADRTRPGWQVRVVPNLYPALERQEVVVHTPRHARSLAELEESEVEAVATALHARRQAALGRRVRVRPGRAQRGPRRRLEPAAQPLAALLAARAAAGRARGAAQARTGAVRRLRRPAAKSASRSRFEETSSRSPRRPAAPPTRLVLAPSRHAAEPSEEDLVDAALLLRDAIRRLREPKARSRSTPGCTRAGTGTSSSCRG